MANELKQRMLEYIIKFWNDESLREREKTNGKEKK